MTAPESALQPPSHPKILFSHLEVVAVVVGGGDGNCRCGSGGDGASDTEAVASSCVFLRRADLGVAWDIGGSHGLAGLEDSTLGRRSDLVIFNGDGDGAGDGVSLGHLPLQVDELLTPQGG